MQISKIKMHTRNLSMAIGVYVATPVIMCVVSWLMGIIIDPRSDDEMIYIISVFAAAFSSLVLYLIFFFRERKVANKHISAEYLGLGMRILGGLLASLAAIVVLFVLSFFWISPYGDDRSLLNLYVEVTVAFACIFAVINFAGFIFLKPRP